VHYLTIDRFEAEWAVVECGGLIFELPRFLLPPEAKEGDVLSLELRQEAEETNRRRERVRRLVDDLFEP